MYNSVYLGEVGLHPHCFLWRDWIPTPLHTTTTSPHPTLPPPPDTKCITQVYMRDKPAGAIAIEVKDNTAETFWHVHPQAADFIVQSS